MVTPVVCLAHGSRHPDADAAVARIADAVTELTGVPARPAYLDFSPLTITAVAASLAEEGHRRATVVPLLFTRAFHLRHDVPAALAEATAATGVEFTTAGGIGTGDDVAALLASRVPAGTGHLVLYSVGSSVPGADATVADLAVRAGRAAGLPPDRVDHVVATGPRGGTGPLTAAVDAAVAAVGERAPDGPVHVAPLFTAPGTLWDTACAALRELPATVTSTSSTTTVTASSTTTVTASSTTTVTTGVPLDTAVAPLVVARSRGERSR